MSDKKECKIQIPEGYEIDKENSTFERIVFKPISSLTYTDVCKNLFKGGTRYYLTSCANIESVAGGIYYKNESSDPRQLKKIVAINQLFNIAKYYNKDWEPDWNNNDIKYRIIFDYHNGCFIIFKTRDLNHGMPVFKNEEDAQAVIDNPNFRHILNIIFKN